MHSLVNWALLGLVIERPSYAYELARRFERTYEGVLALSSVSHAYTAIGTLRARGLIEEVPGTRSGRQPKPHYRATASGIAAYRDWLATQIGEDRRRQRLFVLQLAALARHPQAALEVLARYQETCLAQAGATALGDGGQEPTARLVAEENRLALGAKLAWVEYARRELEALAPAHGTQR
jgi:DNA-binding PadR family transcriptional regulator